MRSSERLPTVLIAGVLVALVTATLGLAQEPVIVRLGLLTAADSPAGRGAQLAIAEINGSGGVIGPDGGVYAFELLSVPVTTADEVRAALAALREHNVFAILGPDNSAVVLATFADLRGLGLPVLTASTGDTITIADTDDVIFRTRAPEQVYMQAVVDDLLSLNPQPVVAVVQADLTGASAESVVAFTAALGNGGVFPRSTIQLPDPTALDGVLATLTGLNPDVVGVWGAPQTAAGLLRSLRAAGLNGVYFYREADDPDFREAVRAGLGSNVGRVMGVINWTPGVRSAASDAFLRSYVTTFGTVPDALSAAYYDAVCLIATAIREGGGAPDAARSALQGIDGLVGVQGVFNPAQFFVGETIKVAVVFELNSYAVPQVQALYVDGQLVPNEGEAAAPAVEASPATGTPAPTQPVTTAAPTPTATPEGVWGRVATLSLNVRTGPGTNYDIMGQFSDDETISPIGRNADSSWLVVPFHGMNGWVAAYLLELHGNPNDLPVVAAPPSPTPSPSLTPPPTLTPTVMLLADLHVISAAVEPFMPIAGQTFTVRATVRNDGNTASVETALAATFVPGDVYTSALIPPLMPGQSVIVTLTPQVTGSGTYTVQLVTDLNNLVDEGPAGEANNLYPVTYTLDHAVIASGAHSLAAPLQEHDLMGAGTANLRWDGANLTAINGAAIAVLPGLDWNTLNYDQLSGITGTVIPRASLPTGVVVGVVTAPEGYLGALWIGSYEGDTIHYSYRVYGP